MATMKLLEMRKARGLSMRALEERSGVSRGLISEIERGATLPTITTICKLAKG